MENRTVKTPFKVPLVLVCNLLHSADAISVLLRVLLPRHQTAMPYLRPVGGRVCHGHRDELGVTGDPQVDIGRGHARCSASGSTPTPSMALSSAAASTCATSIGSMC